MNRPETSQSFVCLLLSYTCFIIYNCLFYVDYKDKKINNVAHGQSGGGQWL